MSLISLPVNRRDKIRCRFNKEMTRLRIVCACCDEFRCCCCLTFLVGVFKRTGDFTEVLVLGAALAVGGVVVVFVLDVVGVVMVSVPVFAARSSLRSATISFLCARIKCLNCEWDL